MMYYTALKRRPRNVAWFVGAGGGAGEWLGLMFPLFVALLSPPWPPLFPVSFLVVAPATIDGSPVSFVIAAAANGSKKNGV